MQNQAGAASTLFLSLALIAIILATYFLLTGKIDLPASLGIEEEFSCKNYCASTGLAQIANATDKDDCEAIDGTYIQAQSCCCGK